MIIKKYAPVIFGISLSDPCNIVYHTNINNGYCESVTYTEEQLSRYAEYILSNIETINTKRKKIINVHGMNVLDNLDNLINFASKIKDHIDYFSVSLCENLTQEKTKSIYNLWKFLGNKLKIDIHYGFCLENEENKEEYDTAFYNVRWLHSRGLADVCFVGISQKNAHRITEIFNDFLSLRREYSNLTCFLFLKPVIEDYKEFNKDIVESSLKYISEYINENPNIGNYFSYSPDIAFRTKIENSLLGSCLCELTKDGNLYPGYAIRMFTDLSKDTLIFGNISEDIEVLNERKEILLKNLENAPQLTDKEKIFRSVPWKDEDYVYNIKPSEQTYELHNLLTTYLYDLSFIKKEEV